MRALHDALPVSIGFNYIGPIDSHDMVELTRTLSNMKELRGPQLLHVYTTKGKGFTPAELDPIGYHAINKLEPTKKLAVVTPKPASGPKYQQVFRSEEHTSELQSLMRSSYAVFCLQQKKHT